MSYATRGAGCASSPCYRTNGDLPPDLFLHHFPHRYAIQHRDVQRIGAVGEIRQVEGVGVLKHSHTTTDEVKHFNLLGLGDVELHTARGRVGID